MAPFDLDLHQEARLPDGLWIRLDQFTHKMMGAAGGAAKANAYFTVETDGVREVLALSCTQYPGSKEPGRAEYEQVRWKAYQIELVGFECDRRVRLAISRSP